MSDPTGISDAVGKTAEAVTEVTKATRDLGGFVSEPLAEIIGMAKDYLQVTRFQQRLKLQDKVKRIMQERGILRLTREIEPNFLVPLLENATLEKDDTLQETWARMLVNAGDEDSGVVPRTAFVQMLSEMSSDDVMHLSMIHDGCVSSSDGYVSSPTSGILGDDDYELSLENLVRLGSIVVGSNSFTTNAKIRSLHMTRLGAAFINACTDPAEVALPQATEA